jgi:hypothetical protein
LAAETFTNTATISTTTMDINPTNNNDSAEMTIVVPEILLTPMYL